MEPEQFEDPWLKKVRLLSLLLLASVALNIGLITSLTYFAHSKQKAENWATHPQKYESSKTNAKILSAYFGFSFDKLVRELKDNNLLQDGYSMRDLALACLVNFHYFDIEKAVSGMHLQRRKLVFVHNSGGELFELDAFSGLTDKEFGMIDDYLHRTKWPLTAEGLFLELQKSLHDPSLMEAFTATSEFYSLFTTLNRNNEKVSQLELLSMVKVLSWDDILGFLKDRSTNSHALHEVVRRFLALCIGKGSHSAAAYWVKSDQEYVLRQLDDRLLDQLIHLLNEKDQVTLEFLKKIVYSVRSDCIRESSGQKFFALTGTKLPEINNQESGMRKLLPEKSVEKVKKDGAVLVSQKEGRIYKVQSGDSLWKIARKHSTTIDQIRQDNRLKTDQLYVGQEIFIRESQPRQGAKGGI